MNAYGPALTALLVLVVAYLLGCFSTGYYLARWRTGQDIRSVGSGSTGSSNAGRLLGKSGFVMTAVGDIGKGVLAMLLGVYAGLEAWLLAAVLLAVVAGHLYPIQLGFRGGKGLATGIGALLVLDWRLTLTVLVLLGLAVLLTRQRTFSVIGCLLLAPLLALLWGHPPAVAAVLVVVVVLLVYGYRSNINEAVARVRARRSA